MLKVMLVEDEYLELEMLEIQVPWEELGFQVAATASNGQQGLEKAALCRPDVVVTDVKMPFMDGIAMANRLRQLLPGVHIIFLSGYGQIEYLKAAMQVGADDYLLKPVDLDELFELLQRTHAQCTAELARAQQHKGMLCASVIQALAGTAAIPAEHLLQMLSSYFDMPVHEKNRYYLTAVSLDEARYIVQNQDLLDFSLADVEDEIARIAEFLPCMLLEVQPQRYALISTVPPQEGLENWRRQPLDVHAFITALYDQAPVSAEHLRSRMTALLLLRNDLVLCSGSGKTLLATWVGDMVAALPYECAAAYDVAPLIQHLIAGDDQAAQAWLDTFFQSHVSHNIHLLTIELVDCIDRQLQTLPVPVTFSSKRKSLLIKRLLDLESATMLHQMMQTYLQDMMALIAPKEHNYQDRIVRDTLQYIQTHCQRPFTIEELAEEMHYSPNHLRYVFKKVTGRTLSEEITNARLEQARRMLRDTSMRVHQISRHVGYTNPSYFIAQFLKKYGVTPVQYRSRGCL